MGRYICTVELNTELPEDVLIIDSLEQSTNESEWFKQAARSFLQGSSENKAEICSPQIIFSILAKQVPRLVEIPGTDEEKWSYIIDTLHQATFVKKTGKEAFYRSLGELDKLPKEGLLW